MKFIRKTGVIEFDPPTISDSVAPGATRVCENLAQSVFSAGMGAAVRAIASFPLLVASTIAAPFPPDPFLQTPGFLYGAVPTAFAAATERTAVLRRIRRSGNVRDHVLISGSRPAGRRRSRIRGFPISW